MDTPPDHIMRHVWEHHFGADALSLTELLAAAKEGCKASKHKATLSDFGEHMARANGVICQGRQLEARAREYHDKVIAAVRPYVQHFEEAHAMLLGQLREAEALRTEAVKIRAQVDGFYRRTNAHVTVQMIDECLNAPHCADRTGSDASKQADTKETAFLKLVRKFVGRHQPHFEKDLNGIEAGLKDIQIATQPRLRDTVQVNTTSLVARKDWGMVSVEEKTQVGGMIRTFARIETQVAESRTVVSAAAQRAVRELDATLFDSLPREEPFKKIPAPEKGYVQDPPCPLLKEPTAQDLRKREDQGKRLLRADAHRFSLGARDGLTCAASLLMRVDAARSLKVDEHPLVRLSDLRAKRACDIERVLRPRESDACRRLDAAQKQCHQILMRAACSGLPTPSLHEVERLMAASAARGGQTPPPLHEVERVMAAVGPFDVLQVSRTANEADIETAFRNIQKRIHPDRVGVVHPLATEASSRVNEARERLLDKGARAEYERDAPLGLAQTDMYSQLRQMRLEGERETTRGLSALLELILTPMRVAWKPAGLATQGGAQKVAQRHLCQAPVLKLMLHPDVVVQRVSVAAYDSLCHDQSIAPRPEGAAAATLPYTWQPSPSPVRIATVRCSLRGASFDVPIEAFMLTDPADADRVVLHRLAAGAGGVAAKSKAAFDGLAACVREAILRHLCARDARDAEPTDAPADVVRKANQMMKQHAPFLVCGRVGLPGWYQRLSLQGSASTDAGTEASSSKSAPRKRVKLGEATLMLTS